LGELKKGGGGIMKPFTVFAAVVFFIIAVAHLIRVILQVPVVAGTITIPMWPSMVVFVFFLIMDVPRIPRSSQRIQLLFSPWKKSRRCAMPYIILKRVLIQK
jgi:hypothetical protein